MLTGESDGIRKQAGDRLLSGSFCISGSGYYELDAVREHSHAEKIAGEAREFRHPPSPLQEEVNQVLQATTIAMIPLAIILLLGSEHSQRRLSRGSPDRHRRPDHPDPRGSRAADERHPRRRRGAAGQENTLVQQMSATEALAAVDTICVDKTGTLTDGTLNWSRSSPPTRTADAAHERSRPLRRTRPASETAHSR